MKKIKINTEIGDRGKSKYSWPDNWPKGAITPPEIQLYDEVRKDAKAFKRLQDKARWEHINLFAVLREWGDPRTWQ